MERKKITRVNIGIPLALFLAINLFFICKYTVRVGLNPIPSTVIYGLGVIGVGWLYSQKIHSHITERFARSLSIIIAIGIVSSICISIFLINPLTIRVDRWSATSNFLYGLFHGIFPYGMATHRGFPNYPSPFPLWHYLNIPFWLIGDVGWQNVFFFLLLLSAIFYYFRSWEVVLSVMVLLIMSPAYWWEILTRSDGLSNAFFVCSTILFIERFPIKMDNKWWLLAIISGSIASTRLSAVIPIALYLFRPWLTLPCKKQIYFILIALGVVLMFFAPYVLWDTNSWIFFHRNPFMSQTSPGNIWLLLAMVVIAVIIASQKRLFKDYLVSTAIFMFMFMLVSQFGVILASNFQVSLLFDSCCDISYFTLALPYVIIALSYNEKE